MSDRKPPYRKKRPGPCCMYCETNHESGAGARRHYLLIQRRWREDTSRKPKRRKRAIHGTAGMSIF